jgi:hypothetical protein
MNLGGQTDGAIVSGLAEDRARKEALHDVWSEEIQEDINHPVD